MPCVTQQKNQEIDRVKQSRADMIGKYDSVYIDPRHHDPSSSIRRSTLGVVRKLMSFVQYAPENAIHELL